MNEAGPARRGWKSGAAPAPFAACLAALALLWTHGTASIAADYELAIVDSMRRVRIDEPWTGHPERAGALTVRPHADGVAAMVRSTPGYDVAAAGPRTVSLAAAGNEAESFQLVIMPGDEGLKRVVLHASPLRPVEAGAPAGAVIAPEQITFRQVGYVRTQQKPAYGVERLGWFADPLLDPAHFDIRAGDVQPVWVTVHVPPGAPAGDYRGTVTVAPQNAEPAVVHLHLRVWAFCLPERGGLPVAFSWAETISRSIHGPEHWDEQGLRRRYVDLLLAHRIGPDNIYRGSPPSPEDVQYAARRGATAFNLLNVGWPERYSDDQIDAILQRIEPHWPAYREAGLDELAYVFGFDETYHEHAIRQVYGAVGERFPGLRRVVCTGWRGDTLSRYVDIWSWGVGAYWSHHTRQRGTMDALRARNVEFWLYFSTASGPPRPNWFIESPLIESRSSLWHVHRHRADGFLYYCINHIVGPQTPIDEYGGPYTDWDPLSYGRHHGDGHLIYAGRNGPLSSIRLANIRDGLEDYEYMHKLEGLLIEHGMAEDRRRARLYINRKYVGYVVQNFWIHTHDPGVLRTVRRRVAGAIEELKGGPGP